MLSRMERMYEDKRRALIQLIRRVEPTFFYYSVVRRNGISPTAQLAPSRLYPSLETRYFLFSLLLFLQIPHNPSQNTPPTLLQTVFPVSLFHRRAGRVPPSLPRPHNRRFFAHADGDRRSKQRNVHQHQPVLSALQQRHRAHRARLRRHPPPRARLRQLAAPAHRAPVPSNLGSLIQQCPERCHRRGPADQARARSLRPLPRCQRRQAAGRPRGASSGRAERDRQRGAAVGIPPADAFDVCDAFIAFDAFLELIAFDICGGWSGWSGWGAGNAGDAAVGVGERRELGESVAGVDATAVVVIGGTAGGRVMVCVLWRFDEWLICS